MKISGYIFDKVYRALPWHFRLLIIISIAFLLFTTIFIGRSMFKADPRNEPGPLEFIPSAPYSGLDPALSYDPTDRKAVLVFTKILGVQNAEKQSFAPGIALATSSTPCKEWQLVREDLFAPQQDVIVAPDGKTSIAAGTWRYETPTIVFDSEDVGHEWKLFAYKYLWTHDGNQHALRRYNGIVMRSSSQPATIDWSPETWVFATQPEYPPSPYQELVQTQLNALSPELTDITMYSRPSALVFNNQLFLSLSAFTSSRTADRIVLLRSNDHGKSWSYLGSPLKADEVRKLGPYVTLAGATLIKKQDQVYLSAVFGDATVTGLGTFFFKFKDLEKALLENDKKNNLPLLIEHFPRFSVKPTNIGGGFAAFDDACTHTGMLTGEHSGLRGVFQIFKTRKDLSFD